VGGLIGVDRGVLDDGLARAGRDSWRCRLQPVQQERWPVEEEVEIAVGRGRDLPDARDGAECGGDLLRDGARRLP